MNKMLMTKEHYEAWKNNKMRKIIIIESETILDNKEIEENIWRELEDIIFRIKSIDIQSKKR